MCYYTNVGPLEGPAFDRRVPPTIDVLEQPNDVHRIGTALCIGAGAKGIALWRLIVHGAALTGRYTRPRALDIEAAASKLPSLKPEGDRPEALAATGTDSGTVRYPCAADVGAPGEAPGRNPNECNAITSSSAGPILRHPDPLKRPEESARTGHFPHINPRLRLPVSTTLVRSTRILPRLTQSGPVCPRLCVHPS
jgi:hypothetical protein